MTIQKLLYQSIVWRGLYFISAFALNIVLARTLEAGNNGVLFFMVNVYTFVLMILSLGLESAIGFFAAKNPTLQSKLLNFALLATVVIGLSAALIFYLVPALNTPHNNVEIPIIFAVCFIGGNFLLGCGSVLFYARENFILPNILGITVNVLLIIYFFRDPGYQHTQMIYYTSFAALAVVTAVAFYTRYAGSNTGLPGKREINELFRYSLRAYIGNLLFFILYRIDYWFVERFCTAAELGNYIQVSRLAQMFFVIPGILASAVLPFTASGRREQAKDILTRVCRVLLFSYAIVCLILIATGNWLFPWLYGESFHDMYYPFLFLVPGILGLSTLYTLTAYYAGKNRQKVNLIGALIGLIVIVTGDILFIPRYGINAAALVCSAGYISYHIYVLLTFTKEYETPIGDFFKIKLSDLAAISRLLRRVDKSNHEVQQ